MRTNDKNGKEEKERKGMEVEVKNESSGLVRLDKSKFGFGMIDFK